MFLRVFHGAISRNSYTPVSQNSENNAKAEKESNEELDPNEVRVSLINNGDEAEDSSDEDEASRDIVTLV